MWGKVTCFFDEKILFIVAVLEGIIAFVWLVLLLRKKAKARRKKRYRKMEYTLPGRGNSYIRDRLQTALRMLDRVERAVYAREDLGLRLGYAETLLKKLQEKVLSVVERTEIEEMSKILSAFSKKEEWTSGELITINDVFMRILKLSAKYEIIH